MTRAAKEIGQFAIGNRQSEIGNGTIHAIIKLAEFRAPVWPARSNDSVRCPPKQVKEEVVHSRQIEEPGG